MTKITRARIHKVTNKITPGPTILKIIMILDFISVMVSQVFCLLCLKRLTFFFVELILGISKLEFAESRSTIFVDTAVLGVGG